MSLDPVSLLAGSRGRRLCLEFVLKDSGTNTPGADRLREAIFFTANDLDPAGGITVASSFGWGADHRPQPIPSLEEVGGLLGTVPLAEPDQHTLLLSLVATVDSARYWQEPDGDDVLAASPELREPLTRIANHIKGSSHAAWWATSVDDAGQWVVTFAEASGEKVATVRTAGETLERWHAAQVEEEAVAQRDRPANPDARWSGTWWSRPPAALTQSTRSLAGLGPVGLWLVEDSLGWKAARVAAIEVPSGSRIYEIDGPGAWAELCRRYPMEVTASRRHDWYRATGRSGRWVIPDWLHVGQDIDAVHLSVDGYLTTAGRVVSVDDDRATVLAGWDPDNTYWLQEVNHVERECQVWDYDEEEESWDLRTAL